MLKTYRIIPLVFILFFFGFTFSTVSPVFAEDSPEFIACQQIKPSGDFRLMKQKKNCFRDVARSFQGQSGNSIQPVAPTDPSGGEVAQLNAKISELEARLGEVAQLNARIAELEAENATLREQQGAPADPSGGEVGQLNARIDELKGDLKWTYEDGIIQRCKVNLLKERLVKYRDTNPFHGQDNALRGCFKENDGIRQVGNGKAYSYYYGHK